jgi:CelD/BcsL family acetyltransferase involved in cellulose biosynthesis
VTDPDDTQAFDDYVALHTRLWTAKGTRGHFATRQEFTPFHRQVTRSLMRRGGAVLYFLEHEGVRFAALQAFYVHGICTAYLGGRDPEHPLMPYGPGKVLMVHLIRDAIARGCTVVDFLSGEQEYKMRLGGVPSGRYTRATIILKSPRGTRGMLYLLALRGGTMLSDLKGFHRLAPLLNRLSLWLRRGR